MATTPVTLNGTTYFVPQPGEAGPTYAQNLTNYLIALATAFPQTSGTGTGFSALTSSSANSATAGVLRLAHSDLVDWRNNANSANLALGVGQAGVGGVDDLSFNGTELTGLPAASYGASAAIAWTIAGGVVTGYNTIGFDTDSAFNTGTGIYTVPTGKGGFYMVMASVAAIAAAATSLQLTIRKNGTGVLQAQEETNAATNQSVLVVGIVQCVATDQLSIFQQSGVANAGVVSAAENYIIVKKLL